MIIESVQAILKSVDSAKKAFNSLLDDLNLGSDSNINDPPNCSGGYDGHRVQILLAEKTSEELTTLAAQLVHIIQGGFPLAKACPIDTKHGK